MKGHLANSAERLGPPSSQALWLALLLPPEALLRECRRETYQGSGAGGQKRNRVRSGVRLVHTTTGLRAENCEHREALRNVEAATRGLRLAMALTLGELAAEASGELPGFAGAAPKVDGPNPVLATALRTRFRVEANSHHEDFAVTAAMALTALMQNQGRLADTAKQLGITGSALTRHFKADKAIWSAVLRLREKAGLPGLK